MLNIQINGIDLQVQQGTMIIDAAEQAGIIIPRFCYHKKLSTAASCRMCLVEIEKSAKVVSACSTPVGEGMKIFTNSPKAINAQRGVMEFLLINHPLDCPICDQGGECPLQEAAMGFGDINSRYEFNKRVVSNPDLGPLVAADMTRCIHCTRCLRFSREIAGVTDLGAIRRGEQMKITTYIGHQLTSELSGNLIDLCPVGALTSKPARFMSRSWELKGYEAIGAHDSFGSHLRIDTRNGKVIRVVARECEEINENWISDRDRFSYQGLYSNDRLKSPLIRENGVLKEVDWSTALEFVANGINKIIKSHGSNSLGALVSPTATLEESYLIQKLIRNLGSSNIDHRLRQIDFSNQDKDPIFPWLGCSITELEQKKAFLIIGSHIRKEHPLVNHRLRKSMFWGGGHTMFLDAVTRDYNYAPSAIMVATPSLWLRELTAIAKAAHNVTGKSVSAELTSLWKDVEPELVHQTTAEYLAQSPASIILLGNLAFAHPQFYELRSLATIIANLTGAILGYLPESAGTVGAWLTGCVPHRTTGGKSIENGKNWINMLSGGVKGLLIFGSELERDCANPNLAIKGLKEMDFVVSCTSWNNAIQEKYANAILPITPYAETSGTYINLEGRWQNFQGAANPVGESRPGWKILRVLANLLNINGFDYFSSDQVLNEARSMIGNINPNNTNSWQLPKELILKNKKLDKFGEVPIYRGDALVRRAHSLQSTIDGQVQIAARINSITADKLGLSNKNIVNICQDDNEISLPLLIDNRVAEGCVSIPATFDETMMLGNCFGELELNDLSVSQKLNVA